MLVVSIFWLLLYDVNCDSKLSPNLENFSDLETCVVDIVDKHFTEEKVVSYVNFHGNVNILPALHKSATVAIIARVNYERIHFMHRGYLINAKSLLEFMLHFDFLQQEPEWNPSARFILLFDNLDYIEKIFDKLRTSHVINAIIINATNQADVYSYNPFENFACGRYYERIVSYGPCASANTSDFFPNKMENGLRHCTINIAISHLPPFTINPGSCDFKYKHFCTGIEQYVVNIISEREHFKVNYSYADFAQEFSDIDKNMTAVGSFSLIQKNQTDGLLGFTFLSDVRASAFSYVYQHLAYNDRLVYVVKKAGYVPAWKNVYLEFDPIVWLIIFIVFLISTAITIILFQSKDKGAILLKMWDSLFLHGFGAHSKCSSKFFLIIWIWYAFLINAFYQSTLMSLTTHPSEDFQIATEKDLEHANLRPCMTSAITDFLKSFAGMKFYGDKHDCTDLVLALQKVSESYEVYTIVPFKLYMYNLPMFNSDVVPLYYLREAVMDTIYALYLYKGFPWTPRLEYRALQLQENGLIMRYARNLYYYHKLNYLEEPDCKLVSRAIVPWELLLIGTVLATFIFMLEVLRIC